MTTTFRIEPHALDRFREVSPTANEDDMIDALLAGGRDSWMPHDLVWAVLARRAGWDGVDNYYLEKYGRGIFVVRWPAPDVCKVVGFLRLYAAQRRILAGRFEST